MPFTLDCRLNWPGQLFLRGRLPRRRNPRTSCWSFSNPPMESRQKSGMGWSLGGFKQRWSEFPHWKPWFSGARLVYQSVEVVHPRFFRWSARFRRISMVKNPTSWFEIGPELNGMYDERRPASPSSGWGKERKTVTFTRRRDDGGSCWFIERPIFACLLESCTWAKYAHVVTKISKIDDFSPNLMLDEANGITKLRWLPMGSGEAHASCPLA